MFLKNNWYFAPRNRVGKRDALDWEKERAVKVAFRFITLAQSHKPGHFSQPPKLLRLLTGRLGAQHIVNVY